MNNKKNDYLLRNNNFEDELSELIPFIDDNNSTEVLEFDKTVSEENINSATRNVNKFIVIPLLLICVIIAYKAFDSKTKFSSNGGIHTITSEYNTDDVVECTGELSSADFTETHISSEITKNTGLNSDDFTGTHISSEITENTELNSADFTETYISSETTETSSETNEYEETDIKTSEIPIDKDNFLIDLFFPQDFVSKIEDKDIACENGNRIINISEFVVLDDEKNIKSINNNEIKLSKENGQETWKCGDYSGDYKKNNNNIIVLRTKINKNIYNNIYTDIVKIEFLIKGNNQVYMILD